MTIDWFQQPDGRWVARSVQNRGWVYGPVEMDPMNNTRVKHCETHLKGYRTRNLRVTEHVYWPYREVAS